MLEKTAVDMQLVQTVSLVHSAQVAGQAVQRRVLMLGYSLLGHVELQDLVAVLPNCPTGQLTAYTHVIDLLLANVPGGH